MIPQQLIEQSTLGEIVVWEIRHGTRVTLAQMRNAIQSAGFDPNLAKAFSTKRGFRRSRLKMKKDGLIRVFEETEATTLIKFQFTAERREGDLFCYDTVSILTLDTITGIVSCPENQELADRATQLVAEGVEIRRTDDITMFLKKLFKSKADMFPVKNSGGAYFVPAEHVGFVDAADAFLMQLGSKVGRFPVALGSGKKSVKETVEEGLSRIIENHVKAVDALDIEENRASTFASQAEKIELTRLKIESYAYYLEERSKELLDRVEECKEELRKKIGGKKTSEVNQEAVSESSTAISIAA